MEITTGTQHVSRPVHVALADVSKVLQNHYYSQSNSFNAPIPTRTGLEALASSYHDVATENR